MKLAVLIEKFAVAAALTEALDVRSNLNDATRVLTKILPDVKLTRFYDDMAQGTIDDAGLLKTVTCYIYEMDYENGTRLVFDIETSFGDRKVDIVTQFPVSELTDDEAQQIANTIRRAKQRTYRDPKDFSQQGFDGMFEALADRFVDYFNAEVSKVGYPKQLVVSGGALGTASIILSREDAATSGCTVKLVAAAKPFERQLKWTDVLLLVDERSFRFTDLASKIDEALV